MDRQEKQIGPRGSPVRLTHSRFLQTQPRVDMMSVIRFRAISTPAAFASRDAFAWHRLSHSEPAFHMLPACVRDSLSKHVSSSRSSCSTSSTIPRGFHDFSVAAQAAVDVCKGWIGISCSVTQEQHGGRTRYRQGILALIDPVPPTILNLAADLALFRRYLRHARLEMICPTPEGFEDGIVGFQCRAASTSICV